MIDGQTRDKVGESVGMSGRNYEKPKAKEREKEGNRRGGQVGGKLPPTCKDKTRDKVGENWWQAESANLII